MSRAAAAIAVIAGLMAVVVVAFLLGFSPGASAQTGAVQSLDTPVPRVWLPVALNALGEPAGSGPSDPTHLAEIGRWPYGPAHKAIAVGDVTYFAYGAQVEVLDTAANTVTVRSSVVFTSSVNDIDVQGSRLYVAAGDAGLAVVDVSSPFSPSIVGRLNFANQVTHVIGRDNTVYAAVRNSGLRVIEVSPFGSPSEVGSVVIVASFTSIARAEDAVYLGTSTGQMHVVDVTTPKEPKSKFWSGTGLADPIRDLDVANNRLYLAQGTSAFVVDITDVQNPVRHGKIVSPDARVLRTVSVDTDAARLYVGQQEDPAGFFVVDIANIDAPAILSTTLRTISTTLVTTPGPVIHLQWQAGKLHLTTGFRYQIIDLGVPDELLDRRGRDGFGTVMDVRVVGNRTFVAGDGGGVAQVDFADASRPTLLGRWHPEGASRGVAASGSTVYSAQIVDNQGIQLAVGSFENPAQPVTLGVSALLDIVVSESEHPMDMSFSGNHAYVAALGSGLIVYDVTATPPVTVARISSINARSVVVSGTVAYVGVLVGSTPKLQIYSVGTLSRIDRAIISELTLGSSGDPGGMIVEGSLAFINVSGSLWIVSVALPASPSLAPSLGAPSSTTAHLGLTKTGPFVYYADPGAGQVHVGDVSTYFRPKAIVDLGFIESPAAIEVMGDRLIVSDPNAGLAALK